MQHGVIDDVAQSFVGGDQPTHWHRFLRARGRHTRPQQHAIAERIARGDAVLEYLTLCKKFWTLGATQLDTWINAIRTGGKPDFGANLVF